MYINRTISSCLIELSINGWWKLVFGRLTQTQSASSRDFRVRTHATASSEKLFEVGEDLHLLTVGRHKEREKSERGELPWLFRNGSGPLPAQAQRERDHN